MASASKEEGLHLRRLSFYLSTFAKCANRELALDLTCEFCPFRSWPLAVAEGFNY